MSDIAVTEGEFVIDLNNPEKVFTNKQLWDAFVEAKVELEKLQSELGQAVALLRECRDHFEVANKCGMGSAYIKKGLDTFLSQIKDEGEK